jgi:glycosyltransferase involved in cell wall biosynthesis
MVSARPDPGKGHDVFVEALARARCRVRGVLVGEPPKELARQVQAAGLAQGLALEGPSRDVADYYGALDVLIVPSTAEEALTLVTLEAASAGTPAFGSRLAGIPEAIADGVSGRLFEPGAARELADLIDRAARDPEQLAAMGRAAQRRWSERFKLDAMVRATLELYGAGEPGTRYTAIR